MHLLGQILRKKYINIPHSYGGRIHQKQIFQQISCPVMIQALDSDFWTSHGAQLQLKNGGYIVNYFVVDDGNDDDDDDDDDYDDNDDGVKAKMIPVITGLTGTISRSFRKYRAAYQESMKSKKYKKKKNSCIGHCTHT